MYFIFTISYYFTVFSIYLMIFIFTNMYLNIFWFKLYYYCSSDFK